MIVYRILNRLNGQSYIGQTSRTLAERLASHVNKGTAIGKDIAKYGHQNFDVSVLDVCDSREKADKSERYWIAFYDTVANGYNMLAGGKPSNAEMKMLANMPKKPYGKHKKRKQKAKETPEKVVRFNAQEVKEWRRRQSKQEKYCAVPLDSEQIRVACLLGSANGSLPC